MPDLNALAGSSFVALVLALAGIVGLYRLYLRALDRADRAWDMVRELTGAVGENNALMGRALDAAERRA